jgi:hypothetical protein
MSPVLKARVIESPVDAIESGGTVCAAAGVAAESVATSAAAASLSRTVPAYP